ncbi:hypothetical protein [Vibrio sp. HN007]
MELTQIQISQSLCESMNWLEKEFNWGGSHDRVSASDGKDI